MSYNVRVAKWISRPTSNREIAGSTPASDFPLLGKVEQKASNMRRTSIATESTLSTFWKSGAKSIEDATDKQ